MASIERTAYPRFKRTPSAKELESLYTPTGDELIFAHRLARKIQSRFGLLLLLKFADSDSLSVFVIYEKLSFAGAMQRLHERYC